MPNIRIPNIVKHCAIAIYRSGDIRDAKSRKDKFIQALKIARSRLAEYGFIVLSDDKVTSPIGLTPKGRAREQKHKKEGRAKSVLFDTLYDSFDLDGTKAAAEKKQKEAAAAAVAQAQDDAAAEKAKGTGGKKPAPARPKKISKKDLL